MQVSIEKFRYNELSLNSEVKGADRAPSQLRDFTVLLTMYGSSGPTLLLHSSFTCSVSAGSSSCSGDEVQTRVEDPQ